METPTISLHEARTEWLWKFCAARRQWNAATKAKDQIGMDYWLREQKKWGALIDLQTRLVNEMKGRTK